MRRLLLMVLALCLLPGCVWASSLPECTTADEVLPWLLFPQDGTICGVQQGYVRYVSQSPAKDPLFCADYWLGGEPGGELDLTLETDGTGEPYPYYCGNMCTRAVYSMALSFLGVDCTPGDMSRLLNLRDLTEPYDEVSALLGVEQVRYGSNIFKKMYRNYTTDPAHYSPVYVYLERPTGSRHAVLVVGQEKNGRYLVIDPAAHLLEDKPVYVYNIRFNPAIREIINSTFRREYQGGAVVRCYQWYKE